jgi:integrase
VEDLISALELNFSPNTVSNAYAVLRTTYNKAVKLGDFHTNPSLKIDAPIKELNPTSHIPRDDFYKILEAASLNPYSHARVEIGLFVPIRPGETLGLRWDDVNWDLGTLRIERQLQRVAGQGLVFRATKNKKTRTIPISAGTLEVLRNHKAYQVMNKAGWARWARWVRWARWARWVRWAS